jgi:formate-dependent nitrite reductase membrane component NrfD
VLLVWAGLLAVHTAVLLAFGGDALEVLLLAGVSAGAAAVALLMALRRRDGRDDAPDVSPATVLAAVAVAGLVVGAELGQWLLLISAGMLALALGGLLRERAQ